MHKMKRSWLAVALRKKGLKMNTDKIKYKQINIAGQQKTLDIALEEVRMISISNIYSFIYLGEY